MDTDIQQFDQLWDRFISRLRGKLIQTSKQQKLSYSVMNLMLRDMSLCWESSEHECGRWVAKYGKENPEKAKLIRQILVEDVAFTERSEETKNTDLFKYLIPLAAGAAGFGVVELLDVVTALKITTAIKTLGTLAPVVVAYPLANSYVQSLQGKNTETMLEAYLAQLEKFKISVQSIVKN